MACRRGAGSTIPVSHVMGDSELPFALEAMFITEGVSSRISLLLTGVIFFYPRLVNNWLNMRVSVVILLRHVYKCACIYKLVAQSLGKSSFLGSHWTDHADLWPL